MTESAALAFVLGLVFGAGIMAIAAISIIARMRD